MAAHRIGIASVWLGLLMTVANSHVAAAQAGVTREAVISPALGPHFHEGSFGLIDPPTVSASRPRSGVSSLFTRVSKAIPNDTVGRESHVGRGALAGLGVGLVFAVFKVAQASRACERSNACNGGPFLDPIVDPVIYGAAGAAIGAVVMDVWSSR